MATSLVVVDTGGTGDYLSLNAAEAADFGASADFVSTTATVFCELKSTDGNADTTDVSISGQTTSSAYDLTIFADDYKHRGTFPGKEDKRYRLDLGAGMDIVTPHVTLQGVAVRLFATANFVKAIDVKCSNNTALTVIDSCLLDVNGNYGTGIAALYDYHAAATLTLHAVNNVIYSRDFNGVGLFCHSPNATRFLYHNTMYSWASGALQSGGTSTWRNNLALFNQNDYVGTYSTDSLNNGYNYGDHQAHSALNNVEINTEIGHVFYDASVWDFRPLVNCRAQHAGTDVLADANLPVTVDCLGNPRGSAPTLGAFNAVEPRRPGVVIMPRPHGTAGYLIMGQQAWI